MKKQRLQELAGLKEFQQNTDTPFFKELVSRMEGMADQTQYTKMIDTMDRLLAAWHKEGFDKGDVLNFFNAIIKDDGSSIDTWQT